MDVCKSEKRTAVDSSRPPLLPAERNANAAETTTTTRRPRMRDVTSRYKSPISPRRATSPNISRTVSASSQLAPKRSVSAERRRPSTPPSPSSPSSTPVRDASINVQLASRKLNVGSRVPESLWPSTMRSLSVSFQSDSISIPVSKKEKPPPVSNVADRTLRPSSNAGHKQAESPSQSRKSTPERKRSPLKGKNLPGQSENSKPVDGVHSRLIDQHRWPSRIGGKVSSNSLNRSVDLTGKTIKAPATSTGVSLSSLRRNPVLDRSSKLLQKSNSDAARLLSEELCRTRPKANPVDDRLSLATDLEKLATSLSERMSLATPAARSSFFSSGSCPALPSRIPVSRGVSPPRSRPSTPPSRGVSPSRVRGSSSSTQSSSSSVLSFIVDVKKGKKGASYIEEAHHLRLLHNRYLQWRFANAKAEAVLFIQKVMAEKTLYNVWEATSALWESVVRKRINLQQLNLELKLNAVLNDQMIFLDNWATLEKDHLDSLSGAVEDLQASTIRLPVTGGAKVDIESLRLAICSAVDVMQAMGSSICSSLSKVENMNALVSELAVMAAQERAMLDECKALLDSAAAMQVEEYSSRTHLIQINNNTFKKQSL